MNNLTHDELTLMSIYALDHNTRPELIDALKTMRGHLDQDETELRALTDSALAKLDGMTDEEYSALDLYLDFDETEDNNAE